MSYKSPSLSLSFFLLLILSGSALAEVKVETGEFVVTYSDMEYSGGLEPRIVRTYNSASQFKGIFGIGWVSEYESSLTITGYGPVVLHESGGEAAKRFFPQNWSSQDIINAIVDSAKKAGDVTTPEESNTLRLRLLREPDFIDQQWQKYSKKGSPTFRDMPLGSKVIANRFGYEEITRVSDGYVLRDDTGGVKKFNERGRLTRIQDANDNFVELTLDTDGNYSVVKDNFGRQMVLTYNDRRLIEKVVGRGGEGPERTAFFIYNEKSELVRSIDDKGGVDKFEYVSPHSMSAIHFPENTTWEMTYYGEDNQRKIRSVKDKDGKLTSYKYDSDPNDQHEIVEVEVRKKESRRISKEKHEFFYKIKASGEKWIWREVETVDGATTESQKDENCGCPRLITTKAGQASFDYDSKGRVIKKETASEITELRWDDAVGKVLFGQKRHKRQRAKFISATFVYDSKGNLTSAESDGKKVTLRYDSNGRITELTYANHKIEFGYNKDSAPSTVRIGVVTVTWEYDDSGKIKDMKSVPPGQGLAVALQVTNAFDELLAITSIAKVEFSN